MSEANTPATPEGDAISRGAVIPQTLFAVWYQTATELLQECDDWLKLKHGNHPTAAGLNFGVTERRRELARLLFLDLAWLSGSSELDAAPHRVADIALRSLPPQDGEREPDWTEAARHMLEVWDSWLGGKAPAKRDDADRLLMAACFAAQQFEDLASSGMTADGAPGGLLRAFLLALIDPGLPDLDHLRACNRHPAALTAQPVAQEPHTVGHNDMVEAFMAGAFSVHEEWLRAHAAGEAPPRGDPEFREAATDHADTYAARYLAHPATPRAGRGGLRDWFSDCQVLMANLDALISHTGEAPEDEDGFMVDEIREAIALRAQSSPVVPVTVGVDLAAGPDQTAVTLINPSQAALDVLAERQRQISAEGWTPEHDDQHGTGEMAGAAACYALTGVKHWAAAQAPGILWPWEKSWWKPSHPYRDLEKAGALIIAEMERLNRITPPPASDNGESVA